MHAPELPWIDIVAPNDPAARQILRSYIDDVATSFYGRAATGEEIDAALLDDPSDDLMPPRGIFMVARRSDVILGCAGLRFLPDGVGEVCRVFVAPHARGRGLGSRLMGELEELALRKSRTVLRLDTRHDLVDARRLYTTLGYDEVPAFNENRYAEHWFAKSLAPSAPTADEPALSEWNPADLDEQSTVAVTLAAYEQGVDAYVGASNATLHPAYESFLRDVVSLLPTGSRMLELGSGPGDDALFFETQGLCVQRTDGTRAFVERLRSHGYPAELLDVTTDDFGGPFDVVFANAVLLHLTVDDFDTVLAKARQAVHPGGLMVFTVKEGDGAEWTTAKLDKHRYFTYWREPAMRAHLLAAGWTVVSLEQVQGRLEPWLCLICRRRPR